jgi:uncharacterized membrane protein YgcG
MADFCRQCSIETFGEDYGDLAGLVSRGSAGRVICEGCGITFVNYLGECVAENCLLAHGLRPKKEETMFWFKHKRTGVVRAFATPEAADHLEWAPHISDEPPRDEPERHDDDDDSSSVLAGMSAGAAVEALESIESVDSTPADTTPDFSGGGGDGGGGGASSDW